MTHSVLRLTLIMEIVGAPAEAQPFLDSGDFECLMNYLKQQRQSQKTGKKSKVKKWFLDCQDTWPSI